MNAVAGRSPAHIGGLTDEELVRLARDGYEPAFDEIVHRYRAPLVSYCRRWLDAHRAEEVVQHTLMKAFLCLRDDDRPLALRAWLYRVAHNAALNAIEKKGSEWEELDENYDGVPQPPQLFEQRARFLRVVDGIEALPRRQRDALVLNEFEGRCYADIADELGTSESGVRGLLRRARRHLRETAAAAIVPVPAIRELMRSDAGKLHVDRAGELVGSAGAVGGVGAIGGLTKVAAGVLAAGTIAGGGSAIEQRQAPWSTPDSQAAEPVPSSSSPAPAAASAPVFGAVLDAPEADPVPLAPSGAAAVHFPDRPSRETETREALVGVEPQPDDSTAPLKDVVSALPADPPVAAPEDGADEAETPKDAAEGGTTPAGGGAEGGPQPAAGQADDPDGAAPAKTPAPAGERKAGSTSPSGATEPVPPQRS